MPLLKPELEQSQIHEVLKEVGLKKSSSQSKDDKKTIREILADAGLSQEDIAQELGTLVRMAENETTRMRALETAAKMSGMMQEESRPMVPISIIIQDPRAVEINPILIPRI